MLHVHCSILQQPFGHFVIQTGWFLTEVLQLAALGQSFLQRLADFATWDEVEVLTDVVR